jgi:hypothetical protein
MNLYIHASFELVHPRSNLFYIHACTSIYVRTTDCVGMSIYVPRNGAIMAPVSMMMLQSVSQTILLSNPDCRAIVGEFFCATFFKPCIVLPSLENPEFTMPEVYPQLPCRSACVDGLACLGDALAAFGIDASQRCTGRIGQEEAMMVANLFEGPEVSVSVYHGLDMYPTSTFEIHSDQKGLVNSECFSYEAEREKLATIMSNREDFTCPSHMVRNADASPDAALCFESCPSFLFTPAQYHVMEMTFVAAGLAAMSASTYLVLTKFISVMGGPNKVGAIGMPFGTVWSAAMCIIWGLMDVVPALLWGVRVGCPCDSMRCYQETLACNFSQASVFFLQSMYIGNFCLCLELYIVLSHGKLSKKLKPYLVAVCVSPAALLLSAIFVQTDDNGSANYHLNQVKQVCIAFCESFLYLHNLSFVN